MFIRSGQCGGNLGALVVRALRYKREAGSTLIELLVGIAVMLIVFLTLFTIFEATTELSERNRYHTVGLFLANEHIEMIRSLPYDTIGTIGGIPNGIIPENETITYANMTFNRRTFIKYIDDPADGLHPTDSLPTDYKRVKVGVSYTYRGTARAFSVVTNVAPRAQESMTGAGILRINVTDALNNPIPMATVHVFNDTIATSVNVTAFTNASGTVSLPGAWAGNGYNVHVSRVGYSTAGTYATSSMNPNPSPSQLNIVENVTTEVFFKIDLLSRLTIYTRDMPVRATFHDPFENLSMLESQFNTLVSSGALLLEGSPGTYFPTGTARSVAHSPVSLGSWGSFSIDHTLPSDTEIRYSFWYDSGGGVFVPIPDTALPGNASGFTQAMINLGSLSSTTYPVVSVNFTLTTSDPAVTPSIRSYTLSYQEPDVSAPNVQLVLSGSKTIGTDSGGGVVYKFSTSTVTDTHGYWTNSSLEWDAYELEIPGRIVAEACPILPIILEPDQHITQTLTLANTTPNALRMTVRNALGSPIERADVRVVGGGLDVTVSTGPCGVAYFPGLSGQPYDVWVTSANMQVATSTITVLGITDATMYLVP
jgi:type II secretory pathway pseudopilin PulG